MVVLLALLLSISAFAQNDTPDRAKWFVHERYGMFIHWGIYSGAEGIWKGEPLRYDNNYAEWIQYRNNITKEAYLELLKRFDWETINPEEWVLLAKKAGMKYVTITAKHHDGFALWNSKSNPYNIYNYSPKRDIIRELGNACRKHGLKMGIYYSHWVDWEHPYGWNHIREYEPITNQQYNQYWQEKVMPQMRELLTEYGDIGLIWFDMWLHHSETIVTKEQLVQLKSMIRSLQPNCLINSRLGLSVEEDNDVDFRTLADNELGSIKLDYPWQTSGTVAHSWGFSANEDQWKSTTTLIKSLVGNVSLNGNFMLNIGPRANGEVPYEIQSRLMEISKWLEVHETAIRGAHAFDLRKDLHDWGKITYKKTDNGKHQLFLHIFNWPLEKKLTVTGILDKAAKIYQLADTSQKALSFQHQDVQTTIQLPASPAYHTVPVIVMEFDKKPESVDNTIVAKNTMDGFSLKPDNAFLKEGSSKQIGKSGFGMVPPHVQIDQKQLYQWQVYIDKPMEVAIDASYSYQGAAGSSGEIILKAGKEQLVHTIAPSGTLVSEPNEKGNLFGNFKSQELGRLTFHEKGMHTIKLVINVDKKEPVGFQWLWLAQIKEK